MGRAKEQKKVIPNCCDKPERKSSGCDMWCPNCGTYWYCSGVIHCGKGASEEFNLYVTSHHLGWSKFTRFEQLEVYPAGFPPDYFVTDRCVELSPELEKQLADIQSVTSQRKTEDYWIWMGDGNDDLSSMSRGMKVLITAGQLRDLIEQRKQEACKWCPDHKAKYVDFK